MMVRMFFDDVVILIKSGDGDDGDGGGNEDDVDLLNLARVH